MLKPTNIKFDLMSTQKKFVTANLTCKVGYFPRFNIDDNMWSVIQAVVPLNFNRYIEIAINKNNLKSALSSLKQNT
jgi:hypothetical protein